MLEYVVTDILALMTYILINVVIFGLNSPVDDNISKKTDMEKKLNNKETK